MRVFMAKGGDLCWDMTRSEPSLLSSRAQANHSLGWELPEAASTEECPCGRWRAARGPSMCMELAVHFGETVWVPWHLEYVISSVA